MVTSKNNERISDDFIRSLEATTELVQNLLQDIHEGEIDFSAIKTELRILVENVKELSVLIKETDGNIDVLEIKVALLEKSVNELEDWVKNRKYKIEDDDRSIKVAEKSGKWQTITAVVTGSLALTTAIVTLIVNLLVK